MLNIINIIIAFIIKSRIFEMQNNLYYQLHVYFQFKH